MAFKSTLNLEFLSTIFTGTNIEAIRKVLFVVKPACKLFSASQAFYLNLEMLDFYVPLQVVVIPSTIVAHFTLKPCSLPLGNTFQNLGNYLSNSF